MSLTWEAAPLPPPAPAARTAEPLPSDPSWRRVSGLLTYRDLQSDQHDASVCACCVSGQLALARIGEGGKQGFSLCRVIEIVNTVDISFRSEGDVEGHRQHPGLAE